MWFPPLRVSGFSFQQLFWFAAVFFFIFGFLFYDYHMKCPNFFIHVVSSYHMECLTPPLEFVPIEEWYCPTCSNQQEGYENPEDLPQEGHREGGAREVPRGRPRGRPQGSTSRRVSVSERTG